MTSTQGSALQTQAGTTGYFLQEVKIRLKEGERIYDPDPITSANAAVKALSKIMNDLDREYAFVVNLNSQLQPINFNCISIGSINSAQVPVPNVFKSAILSNASSVILLHNHPSRNPAPSAEDIALTRKMIDAGELLDIPLLDHVIVGGSGYISLKEAGWFGRRGYGKSGAAEKKADYRAERQEKLKEITDRLEAGVKAVFESDGYRKYLDCMAKFHRYSVNNTILIYLQRPDATQVAGYTDWQRKFHRQVNKGEKGIQILAPCPFKKKVLENVTNQDGRDVIGADGRPEQEEKEIPVPSYKIVSTFDVSQTSGENLPGIGMDELKGQVPGFGNFMRAIREISSAPVSIEAVQGNAKGFYSPAENRVVIKSGMDEAATMKTALHELAHSMLHSETGPERDRDRNTKEVEAESIAYVVSRHYGLDTGSYSFPYVTGWSRDKTVPELKVSLETIRQTADTIITKMDQRLLCFEVEKAGDRISAEESMPEKAATYVLTI